MTRQEFLLMPLGQIWREIKDGGRLMGENIARGIRELRGTAPPFEHYKPNGFYLPGLLAPGPIFRTVCDKINEISGGALRLHIPEIGHAPAYLNINARPYREALQRLEMEYQRFHPEFVIGHSWGGLLGALFFLRHYPDIKVAVLIASPVAGTPYTPLKWAARILLRVNQDRLAPQLASARAKIRDASVSERIITISAREKADPIAPPERCYVHGAFNVILSDGSAESHIGMASSSLQMIVELVQQRLSTVPNPPPFPRKLNGARPPLAHMLH